MASIDVLIDSLLRGGATDAEARKAIRDHVRTEPRQWDSADISYEEPA
jgi:hypothetical protein